MDTQTFLIFCECDLKFEISDVKYLVKFGGKTLRPARKAPTISGQISANQVVLQGVPFMGVQVF